MSQPTTPTVGQLVVAAFAVSRMKNENIYKQWVAASWRTGAKIPESMAMASIQRVGEIDTVCRSLEDELLQEPPALNEMDFRDSYLMMFAELWIGSAYAISFALKERKILTDLPEFLELAQDLRLVRVQLEKHQIASDRTFLKEPIQLSTGPSKEGEAPERIVQYDKDDPLRAHIGRKGVSSRRSPMWEVIELKTKTMRWVERRTLADKMLEIFVR
jgi:hypothetical protein